MIDTLVISWPVAAAVVASVVTVTVGILKITSQGKSVMTVRELHQEHQHLSKRVKEVEVSMGRMESDLSGKITTQITDLKADICRIDRKMDDLVKQVVSALSHFKE